MLTWLWISAAAWGHGGVDRTVHIDPTEGTWTVSAPSPEVRLALGLAEGDVARHEVAIARWLVDGLSLSARGAECPSGPPRSNLGAQVSVRRTFTCRPGPIVVGDVTLAQAAPGERTLVVSGAGAAVLDRLQPTVTLASRASAGGTAARFLRDGAVHLLTGFDHVLFLLCLLFGGGVAARRVGSAAALRHLAGIVSAFTVGHSLTLGAAALGWVVLPSRWVEVTIAASIVLAAALNVLHPSGGGLGRARVALLFGLVHGLGFSSVLAETGLPAGQRVLALLSFNLGIELAQLGVVALAFFPLAWLAARPAAYRGLVMQAGSSTIAAIAAVWTIQRLVAP